MKRIGSLLCTAFFLLCSSVKKLANQTFDKIGARNRTEAVAIALRKHLLKI